MTVQCTQQWDMLTHAEERRSRVVLPSLLLMPSFTVLQLLPSFAVIGIASAPLSKSG